jgi:hypothetical protein
LAGQPSARSCFVLYFEENRKSTKQEIGRLREQLADMRARQWQSLRSTMPPS